MNFIQKFTGSRWNWFLKGLPSLPRSHALFRAKRYTLTSSTRCQKLWDQCDQIFQSNVPGDLVECGVWRGGSAVIMALAARHFKQQRRIHLFDSFEGLPEPTAADEKAAKDYSEGKASGSLTSIGKCSVGLEEVKDLLLNKLQFDKSFIHFHVGWFQNTIPADAEKMGPIALLRLDGDWYESTRICLEYLYPKISPGGLVILDDYHFWVGCKKATNEYREQHGITAPIQEIDGDAIYWMKD
ncbi:MAG: TylF/MycF family methyltransferase [Verrucomicrobiota bacterium]|nr:TylF/MycF family methyltransferase [Verrucomicrobiota bacterium]